MTLAEAAATYADYRGWSVFPCGRDKKPAIRGGHGVHDATSNPDQARRLFLTTPHATGIGIACGPSRLLVVDDDGTGQLPPWLPLTATVQTGRGFHHYYTVRGGDQRARNSAGKIGPGIDTRGIGGYVLAPPSAHPSGRTYTWFLDGDLAPAPTELLEILAPPRIESPPLAEGSPLAPPPSPRSYQRGRAREPIAPPRPLASRSETPDISPYGRAALVGLLGDLLAAPNGQRNTTLNAVAYRAARLALEGHFTAETAQATLFSGALRLGLSEREIRSTLASGWQAGSR